MVGDDDSSTTAACRTALDYKLIKFFDTNHAAGAVKKSLDSSQKKSKVDLSRERINYLHRCLTFAMAQNKENSTAMADAMRNIPAHAFNNHDKCDSWCGFHKDPENYDHTMIPGGLTGENLREKLDGIFKKLAENSSKLSAGASSNATESLNAVKSSKYPERLCLSKTASGDYRLACTIGAKEY